MIPAQLFFIIIYVLESVTILVQSSLIVAVLGREWVQVKRLLPVDMILTSLGISHFCRQWASILFNFCFYFNPNHSFWYLSLTWEFFNIFIFWLTSLLAVFYCVKVCSFTHPIFLWLRWRILKLVPWLLLGSLMISCLTIIPSIIRNHIQIQFINMVHLPGNSTMTERLRMFQKHMFTLYRTLALGLPFLLFLASTILLMASLSQHLVQMKHHSTGHCNSSTKAHFTAVRLLAMSFIIFTSHFFIILASLIESAFDRRPWFWIWEVFLYGIVSIHSTSLMLRSPTLKKVLKVKCWVLEAA
ncbi:taste receptor type 2 member 16 [Cynocephalus volans]|uniref:taste receptor type 2 member 16 n=1 Tax=Cynocephalus volans TaxID=110931 RepID=UPI002FC81BF1